MCLAAAMVIELNGLQLLISRRAENALVPRNLFLNLMLLD
jgi:hypothetical protein